MKIKTDFITNSSSTSFIIITDDDFSENMFLDLLGIRNNSPIRDVFSRLYQLILENMHLVNGLKLESMIDDAPISVADKLREASELGKRIYSGELSSDSGDAIETFFCTESFETENDRIYFNYLECVW